MGYHISLTAGWHVCLLQFHACMRLLGQRQRTLLLMSPANKPHASNSSPSPSVSKGQRQGSPHKYCTHSFWLGWGILSLDLKSVLLANLPNLCPLRRHYLYYPGLKTHLPSSLETDTISNNHGCLLHKHSWKREFRAKTAKRLVEMPQRIVSPISSFKLQRKPYRFHYKRPQ